MAFFGLLLQERTGREEMKKKMQIGDRKNARKKSI
jgi:hypothetical protein